mmetsp:Transcript_16832/g.26215  ORF Transcript_16832/g.26215 Transcript_16832/m.26215 type:complete len:114 (+) Transcript_16832:330-671(+)
MRKLELMRKRMSSEIMSLERGGELKEVGIEEKTGRHLPIVKNVGVLHALLLLSSLLWGSILQSKLDLILLFKKRVAEMGKGYLYLYFIFHLLIKHFILRLYNFVLTVSVTQQF